MVRCDRRLPSFFRSPWLWIGLVLALCGATGLMLLPYGIAYGIKQALTKAGLQAVDVADVDFNPFTGRLAIRGLRAGDQKDLFLPLAKFRVAMLPLFRGQVQIEEGAIHQVTLVLREVGGRITLAGAKFPSGGMEETKGISVSIHRLFISGRMNYELQGLKGALDIERLHLSWPGYGSPFRAVGDFLLMGGSIHFDGRWMPGEHPADFEGELRFKGIPLPTIESAWKKPFRLVSGKASGSMRLQALRSKSGLEVLRLESGELALDRLHGVGGPLMEWEAAQVRLDKLHGSLKEGLNIAI
ncbi:hypothetical protein D6833_13945, partial [Candidatus Parcubacteria bacterium]